MATSEIGFYARTWLIDLVWFDTIGMIGLFRIVLFDAITDNEIDDSLHYTHFPEVEEWEIESFVAYMIEKWGECYYEQDYN